MMRRNFSSILSKTLITLCFTCYIWYQVKDAADSDDVDSLNSQLGGAETLLGHLNTTYERQTLVTGKRIPGAEPSSYVRSYVTELNRLQKVHNEDLYGPLQDDDVVIVIQVHDRWAYLEGLIKSLSVVPNISQSLIIFSHDFYDESEGNFVERISQKVTFAKTLQIFYPSALQLVPNRFPGDDPADCPRDVSRTEAERLGCQNAAFPDRFGHYREGRFCQTKHHWWWKLNRIMDGLNVTKTHQGPFVFLEEDYYVAPDVLHLLRKMEMAKKKSCTNCRMLVLGNYINNYQYKNFGNIVEIVQWLSARHNMGMVFYRELWQEIRDNCAQTFCKFDDYNWDWSLLRVSTTCLRQPLQAMVARTTRVFHVGDCGVHHKGKDCDKSRSTRAAQSVIKTAHKDLFPTNLVVKYGIKRVMKPQKPNGGWGDIRDQQLCLHFLNETL